MSETLIDRIYEAAVVPELWPSTLDSIVKETSVAYGVVVNMVGGVQTAAILSSNSDALWNEYLERDLIRRSQRTKRLLAETHAGFVVDQDVFTPDEMRVDPAFTEFLDVHGFGGGAGTVVRMPANEAFIVHFEGVKERQNDGRALAAYLDRLRPHLARACVLSAKIGAESARAKVDALAAVGMAAAVLAPGGRLMAANAPMQELMPEVFQDRQQRLRVTTPAIDVLLADALAQGAAAECPRSFPIARSEAHPPMVLHVVPLRRTGQDVFFRASHLVVVTKVVPVASPSGDLIEGLFDLTPAEARVARLISAGHTVEGVARLGSTKVGTVRSQLRSVLAKTGTGRQAALVALMGSISL